MRVVSIMAALLASVVAVPLHAQADAYARHWPVQASEPGVYAVTLTPELYRQIQRDDLGDLAAFNATGEALAFGPLAPIWQWPAPQWRAVPWFALPAVAQGSGEGLSVQVEKNTDGSLRLRADVAGQSAGALPSTPSGTWLIDTGLNTDDPQQLLALAFDFAGDGQDFTARLSVDASDDLESWRTVVTDASVLRLQQNGQVLLRRQIDLNGQTARYLRLKRQDGNAALPLAAVQLQVRSAQAQPVPARQSLAAELISRDGRTYFYRLPVRIPIEQINLRLPQDNTVITATLSSRELGRGPWRPRGVLTAFRLRAADVALDNEPLSISGSRDRDWRLDVDGDLAQAPVLELSYQPERWLLLTQGPAPYVIAAGSVHVRRSEMPLAALMAPIRSKYGADWQPPELALAAPVVVAGDAAIQASVQERWSGRALWLVLIGAALAIGFMVVRLLREQRPAA